VITEIEIEGFKSLEKVHLKLGKFNLFVGANASGKSNFFDALRVLQGIGYGFTIDEIFNGKPKSATSEVWGGIRGGSSRARFVPASFIDDAPTGVVLRVGLRSYEGSHTRELRYFIEMVPDLGMIESEELEEEGSTFIVVRKGSLLMSRLYASKDFDKSDLPRGSAGKSIISLSKSSPTEAFSRLITDMQRLAPLPDVLRTYGQRSSVERIGESGENFASLVRVILQDVKNRDAYLSWLRQMVPFEAGDIKILTGALGEPLFALQRGAQEFPAAVLSDGTLRFAALAAAFFQPDMPSVIAIEEIENGIHPTRVRLLLELLKSQSGGDGPQVFATTHSPVVLAWLDEKDYETTFFCRRDEETGASIIKPLSEIPHLVELVKNQPLSELFTEGWMEGAF
jgi:energy-coupling factor transporter ATP-binding protein EcfA2